MPHESTVAHEQRFVMDSPMISRSRTYNIFEDEKQPIKDNKVRVVFSNNNIRVQIGLS